MRQSARRHDPEEEPDTAAAVILLPPSRAPDRHLDRGPDRDGPSDAEVIRRSLIEPERFGEIFRRHAPAVQGFSARRLGPSAADDVTAETFDTAFRIRARYDLARDSARPWLFGIATRHLARRRRAEQAWYRTLNNLPVEPAEEAISDRVITTVLARSLRGPLVAALAELRAPHRDVLLLVAWADLGYAEVAQALNIPLGTVQSRLYRARRTMRSALAELPLDLKEL